MNYYIQGNKEKADQIKAAFEKLGYDVKNWRFTTGVYYSLNGRIVNTSIGSNEYKLILNNPDYKELKLPVAPKFKVGDKVIYNGKQHTVTFVNDKYYGFSGGVAGCRIELQDQLLSPAPKPHYDIANFKPFDKVLVRQDNSCTWGASFFGRYSGIFMCCSNVCFEQCIPFEGNEHLLGTTDMPSEEYINW